MEACIFPFTLGRLGRDSINSLANVLPACIMPASTPNNIALDSFCIITLHAWASFHGTASFAACRLGNAFSHWLGVNPPELFFYVFLPPLLLHSALCVDWFVFKKVKLQVLAYAFLSVVLSTALFSPFLLYALNLAASGWRVGWLTERVHTCEVIPPAAWRACTGSCSIFMRHSTQCSHLLAFFCA